MRRGVGLGVVEGVGEGEVVLRFGGMGDEWLDGWMVRRRMEDGGAAD